MIRILQFGMSANYGGIEAFIMNYYRAIDRTKIQFDFAKSDRNMKIAYEDEILALGGRIYISPAIGLKSGYYALRKAWLEFYRSLDANAIHFNTVAIMNLYAIRFAKESGLHVHVHAHHSVYNSDYSWWIKFRIRVNRKIVHKYANTLLACSDEAGQWMFGTGYEVFPNSIDCDKFSFSQNARIQIRKKYGLEDAFVMLHIGKLSIVKNQMFLLSVLQEVKKNRKNARLLFVGSDGLNGTVQQKAREMGLEHDIIFTGMVQHTEDFYSAADIFLFPSLSEGFGIAPVEAQANGLRGIVSDRLVDAINPSGTLRYLTIDDRNDKRASKLWAYEIIKNSERISQEEITLVRSSYDINTTVKALENIYTRYE